MVGKYWEILRPFRKTFGFFIILLTLYEGMQILEGYVASLVVRMLGAEAEPYFWFVLIALLLVYDEFFMRLDNLVDWHIITRHSHPIYKHLKLTAIRQFLKMDILWHHRNNSGVLVGKVSDGVWKVLEILDGFSWELVPTTVQVFLSLIPLFILSYQASLVACLSFAVFMMLTIKCGKALQPFRIEKRDVHEYEWQKSVEVVQSIETAIMFGQQERLYEEQVALHERIVKIGEKEARLHITYSRWRIRLITLSRRVILGIWIWQLLTGQMDVANFIFVYALMEKLFSSFWRFARLTDRVFESLESANRLMDIATTSSSINTGGKNAESTNPVGISLRRVCFSYQNDYDKAQGALHDFSLEIPGGSVVALVGPSGAGKSTIWRVVTGLYPAQSGQIVIGCQDMKELDVLSVRRLFSYVPQGDDVSIYQGSMHMNISFPKHTACREEVIRAAKFAGIHDFIMNQPDGYDMLVGERGKKLSGGQKQRVALARAILADRPVLILDEATSAVDAITEREIQSQMREILRGKTAIIIAHRLSTVWDIADKIVVVDDGRKVEEGTHAELMQQKGLYAKMVALQTAE